MAEERPEWDIFERLEKLEKLSLTVDDLRILTVTTFYLSFMSVVAQNPSQARWFKDTVIAMFREQGLVTETLNFLEQRMLQICEAWEKRK